MKALFGAAAAAALLIATPTFAQTFGGTEVYGNIGYTNARFDNIGGFDVEDADINTGAVTARLGARRGVNFGVEGELLVGVSDEEISDGLDRASIGINYGATAFLVGFLPITPKAELFARVGVGAVEIDAETSGPTVGNASDSGTEAVFAYGAGAQYFFDGVNGVRGEYTRYNGDDDSVESDALALSYVRKF